jgi:hypothetical protein
VAIERVNLATGRREPLAAPDGRVVSKADWNGIRLEQQMNPPAEACFGFDSHALPPLLLL